MLKNNYLYPCCDKWFEKGGSIWIYSDPHFDDSESNDFRLKSCGISLTAEEQVKRINARVGKNDTLIILGDIGNIGYVSKLKAGYKVLIQGNHDSGKSNYQRVVTKKRYLGRDICSKCGEVITYAKLFQGGFTYEDEKATTGWCRKCTSMVTPIKQYEGEDTDNKLFDEVYDGKLQIRKDLVLSHEPVDDKYCFNIHGHCHPGEEESDYPNVKDYLASGGLRIKDVTAKQLIAYQFDLIKKLNLKKFNCCAELLNYEPIPLKDFLKSGVLKDILDMHREVIDNKPQKETLN